LCFGLKKIACDSLRLFRYVCPRFFSLEIFNLLWHVLWEQLSFLTVGVSNFTITCWRALYTSTNTTAGGTALIFRTHIALCAGVSFSSLTFTFLKLPRWACAFHKTVQFKFNLNPKSCLKDIKLHSGWQKLAAVEWTCEWRRTFLFSDSGEVRERTLGKKSRKVDLKGWWKSNFCWSFEIKLFNLNLCNRKSFFYYFTLNCSLWITVCVIHKINHIYMFIQCSRAIMLYILLTFLIFNIL